MRGYAKPMVKALLLLTPLLFSACQERSKPVVIKKASLSTPIRCMSLDEVGAETEFIDELKRLYRFSKSCNLKLSLLYKRDIVCNSSYNVVRKTTGKFPKSYLKFELREGMKLLYSYYIDLYDNVDREDIRDEFLRVKMDLIDVKKGE